MPQTWDGQWYDFHGECDLTFLNNPAFAEGTGMWVQRKFPIDRPHDSSSSYNSTNA